MGSRKLPCKQEGQCWKMSWEATAVPDSQFEIWEAAYGPVGDDGYPVPMWDKETGKIDHTVLNLLARPRIRSQLQPEKPTGPRWGPKLRGKIHVYVGDEDYYYLNLAVYLLEDTLKGLENPPCDCEFQYGRPMKGHGWQPASSATMIRWMAGAIAKNAPSGENTAAWHSLADFKIQRQPALLSGSDVSRLRRRRSGEVVVVHDGVEEHVELAVILPAIAGVAGEEDDRPLFHRHIDDRGAVLDLCRTLHESAQHIGVAPGILHQYLGAVLGGKPQQRTIGRKHGDSERWRSHRKSDWRAGL